VDRSLVSGFKIETKNDASVECDFDITIGFPNFEKSESEYDIRKFFGVGMESELNFWSRSRSRSRSGVGVRNKRLRPSLTSILEVLCIAIVQKPVGLGLCVP